MNPVKIVFGVLSTYERNGWIHPSILQFFCDIPFDKGFAYRAVAIHNFIPAASGRNMFCKNMKDADVDWICMIDNDMAIDSTFLKTIENVPEDASIVVPMFYMWSQGDLKLTLCWGLPDAPDGVKKMTPGFHELSKCGTGAVFIRPNVFKEMAYPYFKYMHDGDGNQIGTEDVVFTMEAIKRGFKVYGNADVKVGHYHSIDLGSLWAWAEKSYGISLDKQNGMGVPSAEKDSGSPPDRIAEACPVEAI